MIGAQTMVMTLVVGEDLAPTVQMQEEIKAMIKAIEAVRHQHLEARLARTQKRCQVEQKKTLRMAMLRMEQQKVTLSQSHISLRQLSTKKQTVNKNDRYDGLKSKNKKLSIAHKIMSEVPR